MAEAENQPANYAIQILNRFGLPTALLLFGGYYIYQDILKPLATSYQELVAEVKSNNSEMKQAMLDLGEQNRERIGHIEDQILKNSDDIATGLDVIARQNKDEILRIEQKIDRLLER